MSFWIEKKEDGTLVIPLAAYAKDIKGDGIIEVKPDDSEYEKYLKLYQAEQQRLQPKGKLHQLTHNLRQSHNDVT